MRNSWVVTSKAVDDVERLDAEHFDPAYAALEKAIKKAGMATQLGTFCDYVRRGVQPRYVPQGDVLVINSQHVGDHLISLDTTERTDSDFWEANPRARAQKHDVVMNSTGVGTIGRVNCILHAERSVVDNHVTIIRPDPNVCDPVYLAVYLNSPLGRHQTYKWTSGSSGQVEIYPREIERLMIHLPARPDQKKIGGVLTRAYGYQRRAGAAADEALRLVDQLVPGHPFKAARGR